MAGNNKLTALREQIAKQGLDGYVVPMADAFQSEFVPLSDRRLGWLTGFTGSAGLAVVLKDKAAFFTDGRYTLQAEQEVPEDYTRYNISEMPPQCWLQEQASANAKVGFDPWLFTVAQWRRLCSTENPPGYILQPCPNLISDIWQDRPAPGVGSVFIHNIEYSGEGAENKVNTITKNLDKNAVMLLCQPESINWLLNIRGYDLPCTPVVLCYAILYADGTVDLYIDMAKITDEVRQVLGKKVRVQGLDTILEGINGLKGKVVMCDPQETPMALAIALERVGLVPQYKVNPCLLAKACKNSVEIEGTKQAHIRDGAAVCKFLHWLEQALKNGEMVTEISAAEKLEAFRSEGEHFQSVSFETIAGYGANGAIVHYRAEKASCATLRKEGLFLLDSGGQYLDGTTDITRTIALGKPTAEQKKHFTLVLKGHIALAQAVFPKGTTGSQLDSLARQFLWQEGLDYDHGTGHGVGYFLNVHEGPQRISKLPNTVALKPGMIISNEPGYYKAGEYGIRIENLVLVEQADKKGFLKLRTLTAAPIDWSLVEKSLLAEDEKLWLKQYYKWLVEVLVSQLDKEVAAWLNYTTNAI